MLGEVYNSPVTRLRGWLFLGDRILDLIMKRLSLFTPVGEFRLTRIKNEREVGRAGRVAPLNTPTKSTVALGSHSYRAVFCGLTLRSGF